MRNLRYSWNILVYKRYSPLAVVESGLGQQYVLRSLPVFVPYRPESRLTRYPETRTRTRTRTRTVYDRQDIAVVVLFGATAIDCTTSFSTCSKNSGPLLWLLQNVAQNDFLLIVRKRNEIREACTKFAKFLANVLHRILNNRTTIIQQRQNIRTIEPFSCSVISNARTQFRSLYFTRIKWTLRASRIVLNNTCNFPCN